MIIYYEFHNHKNPKFPIIFHYDKLEKQPIDGIQWHEGLELLYVTHGEVEVLSDAEHIHGEPGDVLVINSNCLHAVKAINDKAAYYCLIVDRKILEEISVDLESTSFLPRIRDEKVRRLYGDIVQEMQLEGEQYQTAVKALVMQLCVELWRNHRISGDEGIRQENEKIASVKRAIRYLRTNCSGKIYVDDAAEFAGYSKYYFSRIFKEFTGMSIVEFLNFERCRRAEKLLSEGISVSAAAVSCGFDNLSYFTRTFKKYKGHLPSDKKEEHIAR